VGFVVAVADGAAQHAPTTAGGNLAELFDINVDKVPAVGRFHSPDNPPSRAIQPAQFGHSISSKHPMHGRGVNPQQIPDTCRPPPPQHTNLDDSTLCTNRRLTWAVMRTRGAIGHTRRALSAVSARPAGRRGHRNLKPLSSTPQRPFLLNDTTSQAQTAGLRQRSITVNHEDLRMVSAFLSSSHFTRRSSLCHHATPSPTSVVSTASSRRT